MRLEKVALRFSLSGGKKAALMAIPRAFSKADRFRRADLKQAVKDDTGFDDDVADLAIEVAKKGRVIDVSVGRHGYTTLMP